MPTKHAVEKGNKSEKKEKQDMYTFTYAVDIPHQMRPYIYCRMVICLDYLII
jgi:hypothetical protein